MTSLQTKNNDQNKDFPRFQLSQYLEKLSKTDSEHKQFYALLDVNLSYFSKDVRQLQV